MNEGIKIFIAINKEGNFLHHFGSYYFLTVFSL